jgi:hypothetical protein
VASDNFGLPYGRPTVSGTDFSIDFLLQSPNRVTRAVANIALQRFYVDQIFSPAGGISGGAVLYDQLVSNDLYANRDVRTVEPGQSFPIVAFDRGAPLTAQVDKIGGKFPVTDEAIRRNQGGRINRAIQQLANTITRKIQQRALAELQTVITAKSRTAVGSSWTTVAGTALASQVASSGPLADLTKIEEQNEITELGYSYDFAIFHPTNWRMFRLACGGTNQEARAVLADSGITGTWVTNRKTVGSVYFLARGQVGELGFEVPMFTENWRDPQGKQQTWYQTSVNPIVYVTDPFAVVELTGI